MSGKTMRQLAQMEDLVVAAGAAAVVAAGVTQEPKKKKRKKTEEGEQSPSAIEETENEMALAEIAPAAEVA